MKLVAMPSTVIANMDYDARKKVLKIRFVSGLVYEYKSVPTQEYLNMKKATSKGKYLNENIKGRYAFTKLG